MAVILDFSTLSDTKYYPLGSPPTPPYKNKILQGSLPEG